MSGFGQVANGFGNALMDEARQNSPLANGLYSRYKHPQSDQTGPMFGSGPSMDNGMGIESPPSPPPPNPMQTQAQPLPSLPQPHAQDSADIGGMQNNELGNQWSRPDPQSSGGAGTDFLHKKLGLESLAPGGSGGVVPEAMAHGKIVTSPTIARVGESGPEAVIPLTPRAHNKLNPDLLEGHITNPKVPGIRYSSYRHFTNRAF